MNRDIARRVVPELPDLRLRRAGVGHPHEPDEQPKGGAGQHRDNASIREAPADLQGNVALAKTLAALGRLNLARRR